MKTFEELESYLNGMVSENRQAIQKCKDNIKKADQAIEKANADLLVAETEVNVDNYNKAKDAIWSATHAKELFQKQHAKLKQEQLVTKAEYNQLLKEITQAANETHEEQNSRAADLIAELREISEESSQTWTKANQLMRLLQREVYREPEGKIPNGDGTTTWSSDKEYRNPDTVHHFYQSKISGTTLAKLSGERENAATTSRYWG